MFPKSQWKLVEALALATTPGHTVSAHVFCFTEEDYIETCRKLIPDHEINRQVATNGTLVTLIKTPDGHTLAVAYLVFKQEVDLGQEERVTAVSSGH